MVEIIAVIAAVVALVATLATSIVRPIWVFTVLLGVLVSPLFLHLERFQVVLICLGGGALLFVLLVGSGRSVTIPKNAVLFSALGYLLLNAFFGLAFFENSLWDTLGELFPWLEMLLFYLLALNLFERREQIDRLFKILLLLALSKGIYELYLFFSGKLFFYKLPFLEGASGLTILGITIPLLIDFNVAVVSVFVIAYLMYAPSVSFRWRLLLGAALAILLLTNVVGMSRAVNVAIVVAVLYLTFSATRQQRAKLVKIAGAGFLVLMALMAGISIGNSSDRVNLFGLMAYRLFDYTKEQAFNAQDEYQQLRFVEIDSALKDVSVSPVIGRGAGHVVRTSIMHAGEIKDVNLHNYVLSFFVHYGIIGVLFGLALGVKLLTFSKKYLLVAQNSFDVFLLRGTIAAILWQGMLLIFEPVFLSYHIPAFIGASLGMTVLIYRINLHKRKRMLSNASCNLPT